MASRQEIIDRIEKLYALASGGTSPGEVAAAVAKAEKIARKHGIQDSEINKNVYTKGTKVRKQVPPKHSTPPSWDDYSTWTKRRFDEYDDFMRRYRSNIYDTIVVYADKIRETDKAILFNIHLDAAMYPWSPLPEVLVSIWMPKSMVFGQLGERWLLNETILRKNLENNIPWLIKYHPVFKNRYGIEFHFRRPV